MSNRHLLLLFFFFGSVLSSRAATFTAISSGNWQDNIWDKAGYPGANDDVIIDGFSVTISGPTIYQANSLTLTNTAELNTTTELMLNEGNLNLAHNLFIISDQDTDPSIGAPIVLGLISSNLTISNDLIILKKENDTNTGRINVQASGDSELVILDDLTIEYKAATQIIDHKLTLADSSSISVADVFNIKVRNNNDFNLSLSEKAELTVDGIATMESYGNTRFNFNYNSTATSHFANDLTMIAKESNGDLSQINLNQGRLNVGGNLKLQSDHESQLVKLNMDGLSDTLSITGDLSLETTNDATVFVTLAQSSTLEIGNQFDRVNDYGNLFMHENSLLIFNFDNVSTLPSNNNTGAQTDIVEFTNIKFNNTSGDPIELDGPLTLTNNLEISSGIIKTDSTNILILEEGATITGAGQDAYIDGPIEKRGASTENVLMPLGDKGIYAPIEITPVSDPNSIYRIEFLGDPPPIGGVPPDLDQINEDQHWIINRISGSPVDVVMHWMDGQEAGISNMDMDSITTVFLDPSNNTWVDGGRGTVTGSNGALEVGSIGSDLLGDPPPIGAVAVTIGTSSTNSVLPVELLTCNARKEKSTVVINWTTSSEINFSHFELERSIDGVSFTRFGSLNPLGDGTTESHYTFKDQTPNLGINYYRLRSVDLDGSTSLSRIMSVEIQAVDTPIAVPNPVVEKLEILGLNLASHSAIVEVYTPTGRILFQQALAINDGTMDLNMQDINVKTAGTYFLRIIDMTRTHNITILKSK